MTVKRMELLAKGKRGEIYTDFLNGQKVAIKRERPGSQAMNRIANEGKWLKIMNIYEIGPKLIKTSENEVIMEFIEGEQFIDIYEKNKGTPLVNELIEQIFHQCRIMDTLKVDKHEMHNPIKHIVIRNNKPVLIDFERCRNTETPKNVTQFCQFLVKIGMEVDKQKIKRLLISYKKTYDEKTYRDIIKTFH